MSHMATSGKLLCVEERQAWVFRGVAAESLWSRSVLIMSGSTESTGRRSVEGAHGAGGMGLCDVVPRRFFSRINMELTWRHIITSNWFEGGKMPLVQVGSPPATFAPGLGR